MFGAIKKLLTFRFEGNWENGLKKGSGTYTFSNGDVFAGEYENNVRHGNGDLRKTDGEERTEAWKDGKLISFKITKEKSGNGNGNGK